MHPIHDLIRKARKRGGAVEGAAARARMDRKPGKRATGGPAEPFEREPRAAGGSLRSKFNAAVNDQPARPTIRESGPVPAVHNRELGIDEPHKPLEPNKGWVDGQPRKRGGRMHGGYAGDDDGQPAKRGGRASGGDVPEWPGSASDEEIANRVQARAPQGEGVDRNYARGGKLSAHERQAMPKSDFALPGKGAGPKGAGAGSYPVNDPKHARLALSMVSRYGSPTEKARVRAKVHAKYPEID